MPNEFFSKRHFYAYLILELFIVSRLNFIFLKKKENQEDIQVHSTALFIQIWTSFSLCQHTHTHTHKTTQKNIKGLHVKTLQLTAEQFGFFYKLLFLKKQR